MDPQKSGYGGDDELRSVDWEAVSEAAERVTLSSLPLPFRIVLVRRLAEFIERLLAIHCGGVYYLESDPMDVAYIHAKTNLLELINSEGLEDLAEAFPADHVPDSLYHMDFPDALWEDFIRPAWHAFRGAVNQAYVRIRKPFHTPNLSKWAPAEECALLWNVAPEELVEKIRAGEIDGRQSWDGTWRICPWALLEQWAGTMWAGSWDRFLESASQSKEEAERELLRREEDLAARLRCVAPSADRSSSRQQGKKRGARRLEERPDWDEKTQKVAEWQQYIKRGTKTKVAAQLVGISVRTLRSWLARLNELNNGRNQQE